MITGRGYALAGASVALAAAGWFLGYPEVAALGIAGLAVFCFALGWAGYRPHLAVERTVAPDRVTVGDPATGLIEVTNLGRRTCPVMVASEQCTRGTIELSLPRLAPGASRSTPYDLPTDARGIVEVGPLVLRRADPFRLVASEKHYGARRTLWVHPRVHHIAPVPTGRSRDLDGPTSDTAPQGGLAFHTLREYVRGDDRRHIHWRSTARTGTLMVRHLVDASQPVVTILLDTRAERYDGPRFEHAVEAAGSIVLASTWNRFPVHFRTTDGLDLGGHTRGLKTGELLDTLAGIDVSPDGDLAELARSTLSGVTGGSLVLVSGALNGRDAAVIARMRSAFDNTILVTFVSAADGAAIAIPGVTVLTGDTPEAFLQSWKRLRRA